MTDTKISYLLYSEFKTSNWYIYWDRDFSRIKKHQLLVVWYIKDDNQILYDYITLKNMLKNNTAENGLPYLSNLSKEEIQQFLLICEEFCMDVELEFGIND